MDAWMESMAELMKLGHSGFDFSLSDVRALLPSAKLCGVVAVFAVFCLLCAWEDRWASTGHNHKSGTGRE